MSRLALALVCTALVSSAAAAKGHFAETDLVSDLPGRAQRLDGNLVNPWGLAASPTSPWWVADNGSGLSTLYDGDGTILPLVVMVPGDPSGTAFQSTSGFVVANGGHSAPANFLFVSEDGTISGWAPTVGTGTPSTQAFVAVDNSAAGAVYKSVTLAEGRDHRLLLYAANFHAGTVEIYDDKFARVHAPHAFVDRALPDGFAPFGLRAFGDRIFVTYALQDAEGHDDVAGPGNGFVDEYDLRGQLVRRVASQAVLDSPWGLALAPDGFGRFGGDLLVGNFGDGTIQVYHQQRGGEFEYAGALLDQQGLEIVIPGLWAIVFGNGGAAGPTHTLFFTAGLDHEAHGLFGSLRFVP